MEEVYCKRRSIGSQELELTIFEFETLHLIQVFNETVGRCTSIRLRCTSFGHRITLHTSPYQGSDEQNVCLHPAAAGHNFTGDPLLGRM